MLQDTPEQLEYRDLFLNRDLSILEFNRRVFEMACDENLPLQVNMKFAMKCLLKIICRIQYGPAFQQ